MVTVQSRNKNIDKSKIIVDYNHSKAFIDQMKAYNSALSRGIKWYRKLAIENNLGASLVKVYIVYSEVTKNKIEITSFKEKLWEELTNVENCRIETKIISRKTRMAEDGVSNAIKKL